MNDDWPYSDGEPHEDTTGVPSWLCPDGTCECHSEHTEETTLQFSVLLCDEQAVPMPGARCRVLHQGRVINDATPYAGEDGFITVTVRAPPKQVTLEWAPRDTPSDPRFPFRGRYYVDLGEKNDEEALRRRLHNLGFSSVRAFELAFDGDPDSTLEGIQGHLKSYHDEAGVPPITERRGGGGVTSPSSSSLALTDTADHQRITQTQDPEHDPRPAAKPAIPRTPPPKTAPSTGGGAGKGVGAVVPFKRRSVYDRDAAVAYAARYWNVACSDGFVALGEWPLYLEVDPGKSYVSELVKPLPSRKLPREDDCTHFASCCIGQPYDLARAVAKIPGNDISERRKKLPWGMPNKPRVKAGGLDIWGDGLGNPWIYGKVSAPHLVEYLLVSRKWAEHVGELFSQDTTTIEKLLPGDLVAVAWADEKDPKVKRYTHVFFHVGSGRVAAHTASRECAPFPPYGSDARLFYTFLRITR